MDIYIFDMSQIVCGVADKEKPISGVVSFPASLELTLHQWGMCDKKQVQEIHDSIRRNSEDLMLEFMRRERELLPVEKGCASAQTDLLGMLCYCILCQLVACCLLQMVAYAK